MDKNNNTVFVIGIMSGTSLDGVDLCYVEFHLPDFSFTIHKTECVSYSNHWKEKLSNALNLSAEELLELDAEYGFYLGKIVQEFKSKHKIENVDLVASHGHTIFHNPVKKYTLQIGNGSAIANTCNETVVNDFRTQDVILGGQGAPLVPIGDELLFSDYDACLNLGGFSNISFKQKEKRIAFDIGFLNTGLNYLAKKLDKEYDENGSIAKSGSIIPELFNHLNQLEYYQKSAPKSLGIEWCNQNLFPLLETDYKETSIQDLLRTLTEHCAFQIAEVLNQNQIKTVLCSGGGTFNQFLIQRIQEQTKAEIIIPTKEIIEYKEALIFALLGVLRLCNQTNVLCSVTGASKNHSSGLIHFPQ